MKRTEKHTNKTILRVILAAAAVLILCGAAVGAAGAATFPSDWKELTSSTTIEAGTNYYLDGNVELSNTLTIPSGNQVIIDLNGYVLKGAKNRSVIIVNGDLKVQDSDSDKVHRFTGSLPGLLTWNESATGSFVEVKGGCITGGNMSYGGGVCVNNGGKFTLSGGCIIGNSAAGGGGVLVYNTGTFTMSGGSITGNTATSDGGGVYIRGTFTMSDGSITENTADNSGGGVFVNRNTFTMTGGTIQKNKAFSGITHSDWGGGGVCVYETGSKFTMSGGKISENSAPYGSGGGVFVIIGTFEMSGSATSITGNNAKSGGGVCVTKYGGKFTLSGGEIKENTATTGGGVYVDTPDTFTMSGGSITGNTATSDGGGVYTRGTFTMSDSSSITGNTANNSGGGVFVNNASFTMTGGTIQKNVVFSGATHPDWGGGGVCIYKTNSTFEMSGTASITGNSAPYGSGGGVLVLAGTFKIGGSPVIKNNIGLKNTQTDSSVSNVHLTSTRKITISSSLSNAKIGVYPGGGAAKGTIFTNEWNTAAAEPDSVFTADGARHNPVLSGSEVMFGDASYSVYSIDGSEVGGYAALQKAYNAATAAGDNSTIVVLKDTTETATTTMNRTKSVTLDLNGQVIKGSGTGSVIVLSNGGTLRLIDTGKDPATHYFTVKSDGPWELLDSAPGTSTPLETLLLNGTIPAAESVVAVPGGCITGGSSSEGGGAVQVQGASLIMTGGTIIGNKATGIDGGKGGGGVSVKNNGTFTMSGTARVIGNHSAERGGGVSIGDYNSSQEGTFKLSDNAAVSYNSASNDGGGIFIWYSPSATQGWSRMDGGLISGNTANGSGGGVFVDGNIKAAYFTMSGGSITKNCAAATSGGGGGVAINLKGVFTMSGGSITKNSAPGNGGGVYLLNGTFNMSGGEIKENTATTGGGVNISEGTFNISVSPVIKGNTDNSNPAAPNNVYLASGKKITLIGTLTGSPEIYVNPTAGAAPGTNFTTGWQTYRGDLTPDAVFFADGGAYVAIPVKTNSGCEVCFADKVYLVCDGCDAASGGFTTLGSTYETFSSAYSAATDGKHIVVLRDVTNDDIAVSDSAKSVTLDLNGHVIKRTPDTNSVITLSNGGKLTLIDSNTGNLAHYFKVGDSSVYDWTLCDTVTDNQKNAALLLESIIYKGGEYRYSKLDGTTAKETNLKTGDIIKVTGGCITGGGAGGVNVTNGTFTMTGGTIIGNKAASDGSGGGVNVASGSVFSVSGSPVIKGNMKTGTDAPNNVWLDASTFVRLAGKLESAAEIHITNPVRSATWPDDPSGCYVKFGVVDSGYTAASQADANQFVADSSIVQAAKFISPTGGLDPYLEWWPAEFMLIVNKLTGGTINGTPNPAPIGETVTLTQTPDKGYKFKAWSVRKVEDGMSVPYEEDSTTHTVTFTMPWDVVSITAEFEPIPYKVTFNKNYSMGEGQDPFTPADVYAYYNKNMPELDTSYLPEKWGYKFEGYYDKQTGGKKYYNANLESAATWDKTDAAAETTGTTLYARWSEDPVPYTITYKMCLGETEQEFDGVYLGPRPTEYYYKKEGEAGTIQIPQAFKPGYTFGGWYLDSACAEGPVTEIPESEHKNITLYAKLTVKVYKISYYKNEAGDSFSDSESAEWKKMYKYGDAYILPKPENPTDTIVFENWHTDLEKDDSKITEITADTFGDLSLYAKWTGGEPVTVIFDAKGGTFNDGSSEKVVISVLHNPVTKPENPVNPGNSFAGWWYNEVTYDASDLPVPEVKQWYFTASVEEDTYLFAKWDGGGDLTVTVTFDANGGTFGDDQQTKDVSLPLSTKVDRPKDPVRSGYEFDDWYTSSDGGSKWDFDAIVGENMKLYAKWTPKTYNISYYKNAEGDKFDPAESAEWPLRYTCGTGVELPTPSAKTEYTFDGWFKNAEYTDGPVTSITSTDFGDISLYAKWTPETYSISYYKNAEGEAFDPAESAEWPATYTYGTGVDLLPTPPAKTGYTVVGWFKNAEYTDGPVTSITSTEIGDISLYAKWIKNSSGSQGGSSVWEIPVQPAGDDSSVITTDITDMPYSTITGLSGDVTGTCRDARFIAASSGDLEKIAAVSKPLADRIRTALDKAAADGVPLTNSIGAKTLFNISESIPDIELVMFTQVLDVKSADGSKVTTVPFKVLQSAISAQGLTTNDVTLYHYLEAYDLWIPLETRLVSTDGTYAYYEAATDGASPFGVLLKKVDVPEAKPVQTDGAKTPAPVAGLVIGLAAAVLFAAARRK